MQNALTNHDRLTKVIEHAVCRGSGYAASQAASLIDSEFILIAKADLPPVKTKMMYNPVQMEEEPKAIAGSARVSGKAPSSYYWERARSFIAIAQYVEAEEAKQAKRELRGKREEAYKMLYPMAPTLWNYETADPQVKTKIDVVVNLMKQVDELKKTK